MPLYQSYQWGDEKAEKGFDSHLSSLGMYPAFLLASLSPGPLPLHVKRIAGQTEHSQVFSFSTLCTKPLPFGRLRLQTILYKLQGYGLFSKIWF